jgi:hypothetical protein
MNALIRYAKPYRFIFQKAPHFTNVIIRKNLSALAENTQCYDTEYHDSYYMNEALFIENYPVCWYCKGTRYVECTFCNEGCHHCNHTKMTPCPYCNDDKKTNFDLILMTNLNV